MAVTLTGTGGLFTRHGKHIKALGHIRGNMGVTAPSPSSAWGASGHTIVDSAVMYDGIQDQYESTLMDLISGLYADQSAYRQSLSSRYQYFQGLAQNTLIYMAHADTPLASLGLSEAMTLLISQMNGSSNTVKANTPGVTPAAVSGNVGNPTFTASVVGANGKNLEYVIPEVIHAKVATDKNNGATAGLESLNFSSPFAITDPLSHLWPGGSGASGNLAMCSNAVDADSSVGGNILKNSDMEVFTTANLPDYFTKITGTLGTSIVASTAQKHRGTYSLSFVGDGSELTAIKTAFNVSDTTGTSVALLPKTTYAVSIWLRQSGVPAAGVFQLNLIDGSDAIISDDASTANTIQQSLPGMAGTTWVNITGYFRTPTNIPSSMFLRLRLSTALSVGTTLWIDDLAMCQATQVYTGGPYCAIFRGTTDTLINDDFTMTVTNDYGGLFQTWYERIFGMRSLGFQLPSATGGGHTISESLVL